MAPNPTHGGARYNQVLVSDGQVVRDVFGPQAAEIFVFFDLEDAPPATPLKAIWVAEKIDGGPDEPAQFDVTHLRSGGQGMSYSFSRTRPDKGWPVGRYRVDLYIGEKGQCSAAFSIRRMSPAEEAGLVSGSDKLGVNQPRETRFFGFDAAARPVPPRWSHRWWWVSLTAAALAALIGYWRSDDSNVAFTWALGAGIGVIFLSRIVHGVRKVSYSVASARWFQNELKHDLRSAKESIDREKKDSVRDS